MPKFFLFIFILFSTMPIYAMHTIKSRLQQRGYSTMTSANYCKLWRHEKGYPLSPKVFASELAQMPKDKKDLDRLWLDLFHNVSYLEEVLDCNGEDSLEDGSLRTLYFWKPDGLLAYMQPLSICLILLGIPLTILTAGSSIGGELVILMLNALGSPEALEIARKSVNAIEHVTLGSASTTVAAGAYFILPETILFRKYFKRFSYTNKEYEIYKKNLEHVASLIEHNGDRLPFTITTSQTKDGCWKITKYEPTE